MSNPLEDMKALRDKLSSDEYNEMIRQRIIDFEKKRNLAEKAWEKGDFNTIYKLFFK